MLKFFYRLKRRRGVVLFAVIAMMTLLITMAAVAYFTTRASYKTVISNYDFSQMYISTTSVSDMIISSLLEDTSQAGTKKTATPSGANASPAEKSSHTDVELNYFTDLRTKLEDLVKAGTKGAKLVGVSSNIAWDDRNDLDTILADGAAYSIEPGVLDAVKVTCSLDQISDTNPDGSPVPSGAKNYYFTIETVGFYRYNTITVQDTVYEQYGETKKGSAPAFDTFFTATGQELNNGSQDQGNRLVFINVDEISDNAYFQNKFTIFGNSSNARADKFLGGVRTTGSFYASQLTCDIPAPTATSRHDWIIGGDMVLASDNAQLDLNGNDLYVKGDLYILNDKAIKAGNVFVEGNVYISGQGTFDLSGGTKPTYGGTEMTNCGVFVKGNIVKVDGTLKSNTGTYSEGKSALVSEATRLDIKSSSGKKYTLANVSDSDANYVTMTLADELTILNTESPAGLAVKTNSNESTFKGGNLYQVGATTTDDTKYGWANKTNNKRIFVSSVGNVEPIAFNWDDLQGTVCVTKEGSTSYENEVKQMKVSAVLDKSDGANLQTYKYANYESSQATVDKTLTLDFSTFVNPYYTDGYGDVEYGKKYTIGSVGGEVATITFVNTGRTGETGGIDASSEVNIELPYVDGGYRLEYTGMASGKVPYNSNKPLNYYIHTSDSTEDVTRTKTDGTTETVTTPKTMPIILSANYYDSTGGTVKDNNGYNAFSWAPKDTITTGDGGVAVKLVSENSITDTAKGYVILEMGTYSNTPADTDSAHTYKEYDPTSSSSYETVTYITSGNERVGTLKQLADTNNVITASDTNPQGYLQSDSNDIKADYDNKIILVSNKNDHKIAYYSKMGSTLFGYVYAPNGTFEMPAGSNTSVPVFGGMIVSDYHINQSTFVYGQPDPNLMLQLGSALGSKNATPTGSGTSIAEWNRVDISNYLG